MFETADSATADLTLDAVLARLATRPEVEAIVVLGSGGAGALTPASDYDLLVVLETLPVPLRLVLTVLDQRQTEVYFASVATLERLVAGEPLADGAEDLRTTLSAWIQTGQVAFDRNGRLGRARATLAGREPFTAPTDAEIYGRWAHTSYNVRQTRRMASSPDPVYRMAVELRLLYGVSDLVGDYFAVRQLPYRGEKEAVRYWTRHDPAYLSLLRTVLAEPDLDRRVALYGQLASLTLAPVGGLADEGATVVTLAGSQFPLSAAGEALAFWHGLVADRP